MNDFIIKTGIQDKEREITQFLISTPNHYSWNNVAYIGDAENDLAAMKRSLYVGCPNDAIEEVKKESNYISDFSGGRGAVYDFLMYILKNKR